MKNAIKIKQIDKKIDKYKKLRDSTMNPLDIKYYFNMIDKLRKNKEELEKCMI